jgi:hypothetical protein
MPEAVRLCAAAAFALVAEVESIRTRRSPMAEERVPAQPMYRRLVAGARKPMLQRHAGAAVVDMPEAAVNMPEADTGNWRR